MNILAIDTSTKSANVCLEYNNKITNKSIDNNITHSEKLLPLIDEVLQSSNASLNEIDYLACSLGPGSFTGIRIGISTIKAFAKTLNLPVFCVSSLDILAYANTKTNYIISIMDAKNSRIYYCVYKIKSTESGNFSTPYLEKLCDYCNDTIDIAIEKISNILSKESSEKSDCINIIGDCAETYKENFITSLNNRFNKINTYTINLSADVLVSMLKNYINLGLDSDYKKNYLELDAIYVRPSQAERAKNNEL